MRGAPRVTFTVLGASGFIGSHLVRALEAQSLPCWAPGRDENVLGKPLGHVIYAIGLTADFRRRPYDTVRAHACHLLDILERGDFTSFLYLSTTRLYGGMPTTEEDAPLRVQPLQPSDLYNISKIMGESICLTVDRPNVRIARLSNVYGKDFASDNFLMSVLRDAVRQGHVLLRTSLRSDKDYVNVHDVVSLLPQIARSGSARIYNVANGVNTTNEELIEVIAQYTGCTFAVAEDAETTTFPRITVDRIHTEFGFSPTPLLDALSGLIEDYQREVQHDDQD